MRGCGFANGAEGVKLGLDLGLTQAIAKLVILLGFTGDGAVGTADVASGAAEATTGGDEGTDFAALDFIEGAGTAGLGHEWLLVMTDFERGGCDGICGCGTGICVH